MSSSATAYTITITNSNTTVAPHDGFVDYKKIEQYYTSLNTTPSGLSLDLCIAKVRGNVRYREIINQLSLVSNMYIAEQAGSTAPNVTSDATATTEATSFSFMVIVEHGDASLVTADEYNAGQYLTGAACIQRCVARALLNDMFRVVDVFDPTDTTTFGTKGATTSVIRYGNRIMTDADPAHSAASPGTAPTFEIGPYATSLSNANSVITVTKKVF